MNRTRRPVPITLEIAPLIDIVFILLLFFVVTSTFIDEIVLELNLPDVALVDGEAEVEDALTITITAEDRIYFNDELVPSESVDQIVSTLSQLNLETSTTEIEVRADEDTRHATVVLVLDALSFLGLTKVNLMTERPKE